MSRHRAPRDRRRRARILRAVLAGGIVFGVGATATMAAWNDSEVATGSFAASVFDTESQSAGSPTYASRPTAPGATLSFAATGMSPGVSHYAWLNVRTTTATTVAGDVSLTGVTNNSGGLVAALEYRAVRMTAPNPTATCAAAAFTGTPAYIAGGASSWLPVTSVPGTPVASPVAAAGGAIGLCFEVRVVNGAANSYQGQSATVTWQFTAASSN
ncbi:SipW-dependent-type signal peptide-containing protein [Agromyces sp. H3Y2-19a]|uniref:SipW-dependent-type signal peptide-containing protein n=1 Tax=Agromyces chromiiresistens TaxID=3030835 RepID=UPI0023B96AE2|nr:SipW-dependent-type signal peptide-containing protein [Agromyces chromiiresistens]MDF0515519.1 SipW-dependent-type signal peptide-containing protein [Agromyces chromiiresistens]